MHDSRPLWPHCVLFPASVPPCRTLPHLPPPPPPFAPPVAITTDPFSASHPFPPPLCHLSCIICVRACLRPRPPFALCAASCRAPASSLATAISDCRRQPPISATPTPTHHHAASPWTFSMIPSVTASWYSPSAARPAADRHLSTAETTVSGRHQPFPPLHHPSSPDILQTSAPTGPNGHHRRRHALHWPGFLRLTCTSERRDTKVPPSAISTSRSTVPRPSDPVHHRAP